MNTSKLNFLSRRLLSILVDHTLILLLLIIVGALLAVIITKSGLEESFLVKSMIIITTIVYCAKDVFDGQSVGKRIFKLKVVCDTNGETASKLKTILRNLFIFIWPVEIVMILINPVKRLGDKLAKTKIIYFS